MEEDLESSYNQEAEDEDEDELSRAPNSMSDSKTLLRSFESRGILSTSNLNIITRD